MFQKAYCNIYIFKLLSVIEYEIFPISVGIKFIYPNRFHQLLLVKQSDAQ